MRFFSRAGNATGQISSHCRRDWNGNTCNEFFQNLDSIFVAKCFYEVFSCFVFKHMGSAVCMWLIPLHGILFVEWNQRSQIFRRYFVTVSDIIDFENLLHGLHVVKKRKIRASRRRHWRHELVFMKLTILHYLSTRFSLANGVKKWQCNMIFSAIVAES